ncbi:class I SAM-dependent methyltransferase [Tamlana sp. 2_MG-2023]|uniref:O-methyltransferase n=1 Tax=unclassified Tamlana TaxID=2614803 RepID=UPI0026E1CF15|nr:MULTISPECIES: class I SAM-dependent methyltransferase [unclassified Tamlana]MDO6758731.1 class I SAM-dependent methyltransferase [Tamlana sp. 2_MG-2023]MDO6789430.1 class I SAM-dependent methyltransferase [Tamlana sp. 1_MG-2023]
MLYQATKYIKFLLKSSNQHGVHSPFVYNLVTKCFYDRNPHDAYKTIQNYKKNLLQDKGSIKVTDLGAGSQVMKQQERLVCNMAKNAGTTLKRAKLLYRLSAYFKPKNILELGTSLGIATQALSLGNPESHITTIEGCPNISEFSKRRFKDEKLNNIESVQGDFSSEIKKITSNNYDLIFFDGNHQKASTLEYFETLLQSATNDSVFIFDDIYWSEGMTEAWEIIKQHPKVTVSIDTFFWGLIFFRKEQVKEHFMIRC